MLQELVNEFIKTFGEEPQGNYFAPGRVNLIGEHTDYNGGNVFPCALTIGTYMIARKREDKLIRLYSKNFSELGVLEFSVDDLKNEKEHDWANYSKGVIWALRENGYTIDSGFEGYVYGNIPNGAGLSSSASLELVTGVTLRDLFKLNVDMIDLVKFSQLAENKFIGVNCGIMDQFAIGMGKENCATLLDTNTLKYSYAPINLVDSSIVISNTNKRRGLADSKYNERRGQCEAALKDLQKEVKINALGELSEEEFEKYKHLIVDEINRKRAKHAVYENVRTLKAVEALKNNEVELFGKLMNASHVSLRDDYEVTGIELDTLVELAWKQEGVIGSRMTGAGFGGCTVSLVKNKDIDNFIKNVGEAYKEKIGYEADFYVVNIGDGARRLD
ncbi:Putative Galactokinase [Clostridium chauvoei JF4335]|uniref:Galactokinase n=2 Tax=Clostridium chauvoei TaxID=46867 RepID=S6F8I9_9CLOT|nr:galactokinase [Clostridium chauvoei]CDG01358.1 Putative Galactokinase [Clostridium chauvoei JF4335]ATD54721.1 galactokinase [Clostridium chauvoei]ATD57597.1 galactokinase [Clostridium chauvoei]QBJ75004.1 galactokinase [Clostridium chauvoei]SLK15925.1 Putative Galactokinase [Clostridium chauvoei JF4335]